MDHSLVDNRKMLLGSCPQLALSSQYHPFPTDHNINALEVQISPDIPVEEARLLLMVKLFEIGKLTIGQPASLAGYSKPTFIELLGKLEVPVIDHLPEE